MFICLEASPNAQSAINSPLPRLIDIPPRRREWIYDKHERSFDCIIPLIKFWRISKQG